MKRSLGLTKISRHYNTIEVCINLDDIGYNIVAKCDGYYDPGKRYGLPEDCYPPEGDFEVIDIEIRNEETDELIPFDTFGKTAQRLIEERLEEEFFSS
jgi:hypothetical protein